MDLNNDGHLDLLSGSMGGEIYFYEGGPNHAFAAPKALKNIKQKEINVNGGITDYPGGMMIIRGNAEIEDTPEGRFITYQGKTYESTPEKQIAVTGTASAVHAADWNDDGDYDLLVGNISGDVFFISNKGNAKTYAFSKETKLEAGGETINVQRTAAPYAADWDNDGDLDLLVGAGDGSVSYFENIGTKRRPKLKPAVQLISPSEVPSEPFESDRVQRGTRARICVADWNDDGRLDLLVGDYSTQNVARPAPTRKQLGKYKQLREEDKKIGRQLGEIYEKLYGPSPVRKKKEKEALKKERKALHKRWEDVHWELPPMDHRHGWVWLYLRK
ncbi:MAG: VCBS repeat-containing protein [Planctomycetes bacterium]|nr:VCBS repeat-containing protein [Planctomycetota bacterium]